MMVTPPSAETPGGTPRVPSWMQIASQQELSEKDCAKGMTSALLRVHVLSDQMVNPGALTLLGFTTVSKFWRIFSKEQVGCFEGRCHRGPPQDDCLSFSLASMASLTFAMTSSFVASALYLVIASILGLGGPSGFWRPANIVLSRKTLPWAMSVRILVALSGPKRILRPSAICVTFASLWRISKGLLGKAYMVRTSSSPSVCWVIFNSLNFLTQLNIFTLVSLGVASGTIFMRTSFPRGVGDNNGGDLVFEFRGQLGFYGSPFATSLVFV